MIGRLVLFPLMLVGVAPAVAAEATGMVPDPCAGYPVWPSATAAAALSEAQLKAIGEARSQWATHDWADVCNYRIDNRRLEALPAEARQVVFMGDSITQNWASMRPAFFAEGEGRIGRGISGQTTPQMLVRFMADVVALRPAVVHIMAGTNDIAGNTGPNAPDDYKNNIRAMVALARAHHIRVVLASIPPAKSFPWRRDLTPAPWVAALNDWLADYARTEGIVYVDYHRVLAMPDGDMKPGLGSDGIHPDPVGYAIMEPLTRAAIDEAMRRRRP